MKKQYTALAILEAMGAEFVEAEVKAQEAMSSGAEKPESDLLSMYDGVGVIEVKGKLTNKDSEYNSWFGLVSYNQVRAAAVEAIELGAGAVLFDIDSPGGAVAGMNDLSSFLNTLDVPTLAHTSGTMASAAYFLGASCEGCYADAMSETGSVGVVLQHVEFTEALKKEGVKVDIIRSGDKKAIGGPYEKLEPQNRKYLQDQVNTYASKFYEFVSEHRGIPLPAMTDIKKGGTFIGEEAVQAGLVDKIMTFDEALAVALALSEKTLDNQANNSDYYVNGHTFSSKSTAEGDNTMPKKISKAALEALVTAGKTAPAEAEGNDVQLTDEEKLAAEEAAKLEASKGEGEGEGEQTAEPTPEEVLQAENENLLDKYDASQVEVGGLTKEIEDLKTLAEAREEAFNADIKPLCDIIEAQINTMRVALSLSSVDMSAFTSKAMLTEYEAISATFENNLVVGGVVPNQEGEEQSEAKIQTRDDVNRVKNLGF